MLAEAPLQQLHDPIFEEKEVTLWVKREDLLHPTISGNKWRKLKYNLQVARLQGKSTLLTFGGAYSNHIAAVAAAGEAFGFKTIGIIRGEQHLPLNPTLRFAASCGMRLQYLSREQYRHKQEPAFLESLSEGVGQPYIIPEGGTNLLAVKGCAEIVQEIGIAYDYICCAAGTGGTMAGLVAGLAGEKQVLGFPALKGGEFLQKEISALVVGYAGKNFDNWELETDYHFGGYAKVKPELLAFMRLFQEQHRIPLEPIYTGKMFFGLYDLIKSGYFMRGSRLVAIHTGGLQGNKGFEERLGIVL